MPVAFKTEHVLVYEDDCLEALHKVVDVRFDGIVTDPPYGLSFMGKSWDHDVPGVPFWAEMLRVCKPGAFLLCFGGTRTYHRIACAIEDAGWEIRDCLMWMYFTGWPKGQDISKALDKEGGPVEQFSGYSTQLKPAYEPIILAMKPCDGTYVHNALTHGLAGLNIDGCRVPAVDAVSNHARGAEAAGSKGIYGDSTAQPTHQTPGQRLGRWPANVLFSHHPDCKCIGTKRVRTGPGAVAIKNASAGYKGQSLGKDSRKAGDEMVCHRAPDGTEVVEAWECHPDCAVKQLDDLSVVRTGRKSPAKAGKGTPDSGNASRFFVCTKAAKAERQWCPAHPTVKPVELMRWLVRLIKPPGQGLILDPFAGTGTTGHAAILEGVDCLLIEQSHEYVEGIKKRLQDVEQE